MQARFRKSFTKDYDRANAKIQAAFDARLILFMKNPSSPLLNNHQLIGKRKGHYSINVTGDWRAVYRHLDEGKVVFVALGTHSELYG